MPGLLTRRSLMASLAAATAPELTWAQQALLCPGAPAISDMSARLTIDVHAHFFNGSDLQIREFLSQTTVGPESELYPLVNAVGGVLQKLAWHLAPSAQSELRTLNSYADKLKLCAGSDPLRRVSSDAYQDGYARGRHELQRAAGSLEQTRSGAKVLGPRAAPTGLGAAIRGLPESYDEFEHGRADAASVLGSDPTAMGYIQFILHHFNHRHVNAIDYLLTYSKGSPRKMDLVVAALVDYDWWLARGKPTPTSLSEQVDLMARVSVLLGGRVHGFVAFCPFREIMTLDATGVGDSMRLVKRAIESSGFIGVKLYPPMGFAPWGNTSRTVWKGKPTLHAAASDAEFGKRLDAAMESLFLYCLQNDVPIMAHTNHSNGPYEDFRALAGSEYWKAALDRFPGLSVSFGHFGDTDPEDHQGTRTQPFRALMTEGAGTSGTNVFADSAYFAGTLRNQRKMRDVLLNLFAGDGKLLVDRLMYGTDWTMILTQKNVERYLSDFMDVIRKVEERQPAASPMFGRLTDAFFARNATRYLGLAKGRGNRKRLEAFYARHAMPSPEWMTKVDGL